MISWEKLLSELRKESPDEFDFIHIQAGPYYRVNDWKKTIMVEHDAIVICFMGKYKDKYKPTVRICNDSRVDATIEIDKTKHFEFPVALDEENFDERLRFYRELKDYQDDPIAKAELKGIYDWIFNSYRRLIAATYAQAE